MNSTHTSTAGSSVSPVLSAHGLASVRGERELFSNLSFELYPGQLLWVAGANGSGKSTLLRILAGLRRPDAGGVYWRGRDVAGQRMSYRSEMRYIGHLDGLKRELSAVENLRLAADVNGGRRDGIDAALQQVGLGAMAEEPVATFSAGQCQRLTLARLLLLPAPLWILDEPMNALDYAGVQLVERLLAGHLADGGSLVLTSHQSLNLQGAPLKRLELSDV